MFGWGPATCICNESWLEPIWRPPRRKWRTGVLAPKPSSNYNWGMFARLQRLIVYLAAIDLLGTLLALLIADYARRFIPLGASLGEPQPLLNPAVYVIVGLVYPLSFLALSAYDLRRDTRPV